MTLLLQLPTPAARMEISESLAQAIAEAAKLPIEDQNFIAFRIMEEIADEKKWSNSFANSQDMLDKLAAEALQDLAEGKTYPLEDIL
ncbi:MAG: hypothetical protein ACRYFS_23800 [Janthinobacterium lividum]